MKHIYTIILACSITSVFSQTESFEQLLENGKAEFRKDFDKQEYAVAVSNLEKAVQLKPNNAEAHYFLGYAYSRLNSKDGSSMVTMKLSLTIKSSEEFETVNKLEPKYTGEIVVLDPYSKLTGEWGSLAMYYLHNNKTDSALWAFKEGKKRGGFGDFFLALNKEILSTCSNKGILVSSGDNFTIPLWYLQNVEGFRNDVSVIDISLLNTTWYPQYLSKKQIVQFNLPSSILDTLDYCNWKDSTITINTFSWTVKPSYYDQYLLRGDRVFLSLLKAEQCKRDVYFTTAFTKESQLSLSNYLQPLLLVDKLNINNEPKLDYEQFKAKLLEMLLIVDKVNVNSKFEMTFVDNIRYDILSKITELLQNKMNKQAKELLSLMDTYINETKYPFQSQNYKDYTDSIRKQI